MTTDAASVQGAVGDFDQSLLDPTTWKEPVENIPVVVRVSEYRWSDPKYNKATDFRPAFPHTGKGPEGNSIQQWDFQLERLDAKYALLDGTEAPVIIYAGCDLQKYMKNRRGEYELQGIMKGRSKENLVVSSWIKQVGSLFSDPAKVVGQMFEIALYRQKELAAGFFAKNVCLPVKPLPPTFQFAGEVRVFQQSAREADAATADAADFSGAGAGGSALDPATAAERIGEFVRNNGFTTLDTTVLGAKGFPDGCRMEPFTSAFARGTEKITEVLAGFGVEV